MRYTNGSFTLLTIANDLLSSCRNVICGCRLQHNHHNDWIIPSTSQGYNAIITMTESYLVHLIDFWHGEEKNVRCNDIRQKTLLQQCINHTNMNIMLTLFYTGISTSLLVIVWWSSHKWTRTASGASKIWTWLSWTESGTWYTPA